MSNLLFSALLIALLYYFFYYLPTQKPRPVSLKSTAEQATQTDPATGEHEPKTIFSPDPEELNQLQTQNAALLKDQAQKERTIIGLNKSYEKLAQQFNDLKAQLTKLTQAQQTDQKEAELALDTLLKNITKLSEKL